MDDLWAQTASKRRGYSSLTVSDEEEEEDEVEEESYNYNDQYNKLIVDQKTTGRGNNITSNNKTMSHLHWRHIPGGNRRQSKRYASWFIISAVCMFILILMYIPLFSHVEPQRIFPLSGWDKNTTRDTSLYILPHINTTLIDPAHSICQDKSYLLIVVCSSTVNFELRQSIRETWANVSDFNYAQFAQIHKRYKGSYLEINNTIWQNYTMNLQNQQSPSKQNFTVKTVFLIGQTMDNDTQTRIFNESDWYGDVIQESFIDSYNNLTLKTIMMLKWVNNNCLQKIKYLMKCDDDTFVNVPNLLHILLGGTVPVYNDTVQNYDQITVKTTLPANRLTQHTNLLIGLRFCNSKPIANVSSKWYTPMYMYEGNIYPNYLSGTGYVMSIDVVSKLYDASLQTPFFHLEDVYLTGICAKIAKIKPLNHQLFSYISYQRPCELKGMITKHELTPMKMHQAYNFVRNSSELCAKPERLYRVRKVKSRERYCS